MAVNESDCIFDSVEVNTLAEENNIHDVCIDETGIQIDIEDSNIDEANIHGSSKTNDGNNEQTESSVDDDVEQNDVFPKNILGLQKETVSKYFGMENAEKTTNVCRDTTISDLGNDLSIQGDVEMNNATLLEGSSVIFGDQNLVQDGVIFIQVKLTLVDFNNVEDQTSTSEEFEWNDDSGGGSTDEKHI
jgi:hypothetical protein